jgi:hypothetical protein
MYIKQIVTADPATLVLVGQLRSLNRSLQDPVALIWSWLSLREYLREWFARSMKSCNSKRRTSTLSTAVKNVS